MRKKVTSLILFFLLFGVWGVFAQGELDTVPDLDAIHESLIDTSVVVLKEDVVPDKYDLKLDPVPPVMLDPNVLFRQDVAETTEREINGQTILANTISRYSDYREAPEDFLGETEPVGGLSIERGEPEGDKIEVSSGEGHLISAGNGRFMHMTNVHASSTVKSPRANQSFSFGTSFTITGAMGEKIPVGPLYAERDDWQNPGLSQLGVFPDFPISTGFRTKGEILIPAVFEEAETPRRITDIRFQITVFTNNFQPAIVLVGFGRDVKGNLVTGYEINFLFGGTLGAFDSDDLSSVFNNIQLNNQNQVLNALAAIRNIGPVSGEKIEIVPKMTKNFTTEANSVKFISNVPQSVIDAAISQ